MSAGLPFPVNPAPKDDPEEDDEDSDQSDDGGDDNDHRGVPKETSGGSSSRALGVTTRTLAQTIDYRQQAGLADTSHEIFHSTFVTARRKDEHFYSYRNLVPHTHCHSGSSLV